ncbi:tRNA selenocysteine 1-associated protein 1-like [Antedon mediterranea]|uniref:tRNA selenocysteine 1-associated protein 1-like n=1 Tax=Antedon mediterranea TaxID=105859 RepID=UPI003AF7BEE4
MTNKTTTSSSIYMANLEYGMDEHFVRKLFEDQGEKVVYVRVIRKTRPEGSSYAYCFVDFGNKDVASRVLRQYNNKPIPGMPNKKFRLNHCQRDSSHQWAPKPEFSIFVGDLTPEVDDLMLHDFFADRYQDVKGAKVVLDDGGIPKGFGFVRFYNEEERNKAAAEMQGAAGLGAKTLKLSVATPKSRAFENFKQQQQQSGYYGANQQYAQSQYNGPWNQQWPQQAGGDYSQYYKNQGGTDEWSAANYEQYYTYQSENDTTDDGTKEHSTEEYAIDDDEFEMEHGQEPTDMSVIDADIMQKYRGEFYEAMQKSRWMPVDTYTYVLSK